MVDEQPDDFSVEFETQVEAKSFIERAEERGVAGFTGLVQNHQLHGNDVGGFNKFMCVCPVPQYAVQSQCLASFPVGCMTNQAIPNLTTPSLCCSCRLFQIWPKCSCNHSIETAVTQEYHVPKIKEEKPACTKPTTEVIRRDHPKQFDIEKYTPKDVSNKNEHDKVLAIARCKRNEEKYKLLEPTYYTFEPVSLPQLPSHKAYTICGLPERIAPVIAIPPRSTLRIGRKTLFRTREEQNNYGVRAASFDTGPLLRALSDLNASITTKRRSGGCCRTACNNKSISPGPQHMMNQYLPSPTSMHSACMDPSAMMRAWQARSSSRSVESNESGYQNVNYTSNNIALDTHISEEHVQSKSPEPPRITEEASASSLRHTPPPIIPPPVDQQKRLMTMCIPTIVIKETTKSNLSELEDFDISNSSTLEPIEELKYDLQTNIHIHETNINVELKSSHHEIDAEISNNSFFEIPHETEKIIAGLRLRQTSFHDSVLLKDPVNHPSKIIHIPSSKDLDKLRGYLVPKDFEPEPDCKRKSLPPESVPLLCQHDTGNTNVKKRMSCTVHGYGLAHGLVCTCD